MTNATPTASGSLSAPASPSPKVEDVKTQSQASDLPEIDAPNGWIAVRSFSAMFGPQTVTFHRGDVIQDMYIVNTLRRAYSQNNCPIRPQRDSELFR